MNERVYGQAGAGRGNVGKPNSSSTSSRLLNNGHSRHSSMSTGSSVSGGTISTSSSSSSSISNSSSSNLSVSALDELDDEEDGGDPSDSSPEKTRSPSSSSQHHHHHDPSSVTNSFRRERHVTPGHGSSHTALPVGLGTHTLGLRSFSNSGGRVLSPAQRIAKDSLPSPPATSRGAESERGSIGSAGGSGLGLKDSQRSDRTEVTRRSTVTSDGAPPSTPTTATQSTFNIGSDLHASSEHRKDAAPLDLATSVTSAATAVVSPGMARALSDLSEATSEQEHSLLDLYSGPSPSADERNAVTSSSPQVAEQDDLPRRLSQMSLNGMARAYSSGDPGIQPRETLASPQRPETSSEALGSVPQSHVASRAGSRSSSLSRTSRGSTSRRPTYPTRGSGGDLTTQTDTSPLKPSPSVSPSISASKIRRAGEASRQKLFGNPSPSTSPAANKSQPETEHAAPQTSLLAPDRRGEHLRRSASASSSSSAGYAAYQSARSASHSNSTDSVVSLSRRASSYRPFDKESSPIDSTHPPTSLQTTRDRGTSDSLPVLKAADEPDLLSETPPRGVATASSSRTYGGALDREGPTSSSKVSSQISIDSDIPPTKSTNQPQANSLYTLESLRRAGLLSPGRSTGTSDRAALTGASEPSSLGSASSHSPTRRPGGQTAARSAVRELQLEYDQLKPGTQTISSPYRSMQTTDSLRTTMRRATDDDGSSSNKSQLRDRHDAPPPSSHTHRRFEPETSPALSGSGGTSRGLVRTSQLLPRRSHTSLSSYVEAGRLTPTSVRAFPGQSTADGDSTSLASYSTQTQTRRKTRLSYSPDRSAASGIQKESASSSQHSNSFGRSRRAYTASVTSEATLLEEGEGDHDVHPALRSNANAGRSPLPPTMSSARTHRSDLLSSARERRAFTPEPPSSHARNSSEQGEIRSLRRSASRASMLIRPRTGDQYMSSPLPARETASSLGGRSRARTLSLQDGDDTASSRTSMERPLSRVDVFRQGDPVATPTRSRINAKVTPSASTNLRDLEVGSQEWWDSVNDIRAQTTGAVIERSASRAGTSSSHRLAPRGPAESPSPYSSGQGLVHTRSQTFARAISRDIADDVSRNSLDETAGHAAQSRRRESLSSNQTDITTSSTSRYLRARTPVSRFINGEGHQESPATSRSATRLHHVAETPTSARRQHSQNTTPVQQPDGPLTAHQQLLMNALYAFEDHYREAYSSEGQDLARQAISLVTNTNNLHGQLRGLVSDLIAYQVDLDLDSETESEGGRRAVSSRMSAHSAVARFERTANQSGRLANEQIRALTELLLSVVRLDRQKARQHAQASPRSVSRPHSAIPDTPTAVRRDVDGSSMVRSNTVNSRHSRQALPQFTPRHKTSSPSGDGSDRRYMNRSETVRTSLDNESARHTRLHSEGDALSSPRVMRGKKGSSTSQISQDTVRGVLATSPNRPSFPQHDSIPFAHESSRRNSVTSIDSFKTTRESSASTTATSPVGPPPTAAPPPTASPDVVKTPSGSSASRWRPFGRKREASVADDVRDSPSASGSISRKQGSANLARNLSIISSTSTRTRS